MENLIKKNLYDSDVYQECLKRIEKLTPESRPQWGGMDAAQMFSHCSEVVEVMNGKELRNTPFVVKLFKGMVRKVVVGDKPYGKNMQTHPQYRQTTQRAFAAEKTRLLDVLDKLVNSDAETVPHPLFGKMTAEEKGWAVYKHLDHHLKQFGV